MIFLMIYEYFYVIIFDNISKCIIYVISILMTVVFYKVDGVYFNIVLNVCNFILLNKRVDNVIRIRFLVFCWYFWLYYVLLVRIFKYIKFNVNFDK